MDHFGAAAARVVDAAAALLLIAILATTLSQVVARYVIGGSLPWSEELNRLLFVWMVCIAAARANHMRVDYFLLRMSHRTQRIAGFGIAVLSIGLLGLLGVQTLDLYALTAYDRFTALDVSVRTLYVAPIVGSVLWIIVTAWRAVPGSDRPGQQTGP